MFSSIGSYFKSSSTKESVTETNKTNISEQDTTVKTENISGSNIISDINGSGRDMYLQLSNLSLLNEPVKYDSQEMFKIFFDKHLKGWK